MKKYPIKCSICNGKIVSLYDDNNAQPVNDGRCCSICNDLVVIPARLATLAKITRQGKTNKQ